MKKSLINFVTKPYLIVATLLANSIYSDSFLYNTYNNHGVVGLINVPTARLYNEGVHGFTLYDGTPDQKITLSSNPYEWLEASFFYTNIQGRPYCEVEWDPVCQQDYKDKGFNLKLRIKEEGDSSPAIAIGLNDFGGTGLYASEYIVASYGFNDTDIHFGLGYGQLNGSGAGLKNPLGYIHDSFFTRPGGQSFAKNKGGTVDTSKFFSGKEVSPFFGISHLYKNKYLLKLEYDPTITPGFIGYEEDNHHVSYGLDYLINDKFSIGLSHERGNYFSLRFSVKNDPMKTYKSTNYKSAAISQQDNKYTKLIKNLEENDIGVKRVTETSRSIGLELTQFIHPNLNLVEEIIAQSTKDAGIQKEIKTDLEIATVLAVSEIDEAHKRAAKTIYQRTSSDEVGINTSNSIRFKPLIASREQFFKGALLAENQTEFILRRNLFFKTNLKYSLYNNFDDLRYKPVDTYPAQVRSDVKQYLLNMDKGILVGMAQLDYHFTPAKNHHVMLSGGIFEDMFSGVGMEYLYFIPEKNYSFGIELFHVRKRDYEWKFGHLDYSNVTATANFYYRNYGSLPFDMKITAGEYLAGDEGYTIEFSRSFINGVKFGAFATFTDVSYDQFGEGSFDKGIFFNIPVYGNLINYTWRPLTKDPGAKLNRRNTLYDLLVRFRPID